ncbi:MAG: hypothetical protein ACI9W2_003515 [Gammaproteobacteria bacterium]|jgi:hypothetical protein
MRAGVPAASMDNESYVEPGANEVELDRPGQDRTGQDRTGQDRTGAAGRLLADWQQMHRGHPKTLHITLGSPKVTWG